MFTRILFTAAFVFVAFFSSSPVHAQSATDVQTMLARMQTIMSEMQKLQAEFSELTAQVTAGSGSETVLGAQTSSQSAPPVFTQSLEYGETNDDIARIQRLLATDPAIYDHPHITGFFGPKTEEAIKNLQERFGYDRVGVIGPATTDLLEGWIRAYPDENYPDGVLSTKPTVLGASSSNTDSSGQIASLQDRLTQLLAQEDTTKDSTAETSGENPLRIVYVEIEGGEAWVDVVFVDGGRESFNFDSDDEDEIVQEISDEVDISKAYISAVLDMEGSSSRDEDEDDAEDAIDDAEHAIDEADDEIDAADEDGDDTDWAEDTLDDAERELEKAEEAFEDEDWDEAVEHAKEAEELAEDAIDRIDEEEDEDEDSDAVESIEVEVRGDDDAEVEVEYENGDEDSFDVDEDRKENIIREVADELDIRENDVEDVIEFDFGDIDDIEVYYETGRIRVEIEFESGVDMRLLLDEDLDEDDIIEEIAKELDIDEDDVEDAIDF